VTYELNGLTNQQVIDVATAASSPTFTDDLTAAIAADLGVSPSDIVVDFGSLAPAGPTPDNKPGDEFYAVLAVAIVGIVLAALAVMFCAASTGDEVSKLWEMSPESEDSEWGNEPDDLLYRTRWMTEDARDLMAGRPPRNGPRASTGSRGSRSGSETWSDSSETGTDRGFASPCPCYGRRPRRRRRSEVFSETDDVTTSFDEDRPVRDSGEMMREPFRTSGPTTEGAVRAPAAAPRTPAPAAAPRSPDPPGTYSVDFFSRPFGFGVDPSPSGSTIVAPPGNDRVTTNSEIVAINGRNMRGLPYDDVVDVLVGSDLPTRVVFARARQQLRGMRTSRDFMEDQWNRGG